MDKKLYQYEGVVKSFDQIIDSKWIATTRAVSPGKAKANLVYRYKLESGRTAGSKISLPGTIREVV